MSRTANRLLRQTASIQKLRATSAFRWYHFKFAFVRVSFYTQGRKRDKDNTRCPFANKGAGASHNMMQIRSTLCAHWHRERTFTMCVYTAFILLLMDDLNVSVCSVIYQIAMTITLQRPVVQGRSIFLQWQTEGKEMRNQ